MTMTYSRPQRDPAERDRTIRRLAGATLAGARSATPPAELSSFAQPKEEANSASTNPQSATKPAPAKLTPEQLQIAQANQARRKAMSDSMAKGAADQKEADEHALSSQDIVHSAPSAESKASPTMTADASKQTAQTPTVNKATPESEQAKYDDHHGVGEKEPTDAELLGK